MAAFQAPPSGEFGSPDDFPGEWVAVRFGKVRAHHVSDVGLVPLVRGLPRSTQDGIVMYRVPAVGEDWGCIGPVEWWSA